MTHTAGGGCRASVEARGGHTGAEWPTHSFVHSTSTSSRTGGSSHQPFPSPLSGPSPRRRSQGHYTATSARSGGTTDKAGGGRPAAGAESTPPGVWPAGPTPFQWAEHPARRAQSHVCSQRMGMRGL